MPFYLTRIGAKRIASEKSNLQEQLKAVQKRKGPLGQEGTWHDNAEFEELVRKEAMINGQLRAINEKMAQARMAPDCPPDCEKLRIGHVAKMTIDGEFKTVRIGGFEDSDPDATPQVISYLAPLVVPIMGKSVGTEIVITIQGRKRRVVLEGIEYFEPEKGGAS